MIGPCSVWAKEFLFLFLAFFSEKLHEAKNKKKYSTSFLSFFFVKKGFYSKMSRGYIFRSRTVASWQFRFPNTNAKKHKGSRCKGRVGRDYKCPFCLPGSVGFTTIIAPSKDHRKWFIFSLAQALSDNKTFLTALLVEKESEPLLCFWVLSFLLLYGYRRKGRIKTN